MNRLLCEAAKTGETDVTNLLIAKGADVDTIDDGKFPLYYAYEYNQETQIKILLNNGANIDNMVSGSTMLKIECEKVLPNVQVIKSLLDCGADPNLLCNGNAAIHVACQMNNIGALELLTSYPRTNINLKNSTGMTGLIISSSEGHYDIVVFLLKKNADANIQGDCGITALMVSIINFKHEITLLLLLHDDTNLRLEDTNGNSILHSACISKNVRATYLLAAKNVDYSLKNNKGLTAQEECEDNEIKWLLDQHIKIQNKLRVPMSTKIDITGNERKWLASQVKKRSNASTETVHFKAIISTKNAIVTVCDVTGIFGFTFGTDGSTYQMWNKDLMCWNTCRPLPIDFKAMIECSDKKILYHVSARHDNVHIRFNNLRKLDRTLMSNIYE